MMLKLCCCFDVVVVVIVVMVEVNYSDVTAILSKISRFFNTKNTNIRIRIAINIYRKIIILAPTEIIYTILT